MAAAARTVRTSVRNGDRGMPATAMSMIGGQLSPAYKLEWSRRSGGVRSTNTSSIAFMIPR